jgi:hypothetical protein
VNLDACLEKRDSVRMAERGVGIGDIIYLVSMNRN